MVVPAAPFLAILSQRPGEPAWWAASHASHASVDSKVITGSGSGAMRAVNHDRPTAPGRDHPGPLACAAGRVSELARVGAQNPAGGGPCLTIRWLVVFSQVSGRRRTIEGSPCPNSAAGGACS